MVSLRLDAGAGFVSQATRFARALGLVLFVLLLGTATSRGQSTQGSILGNVADPVGAVVPGVAIEVNSQETGLVESTDRIQKVFI